jgi:hypothetical protein
MLAAVLQVAALQTEAVLDVLTDEWVVNTPDEGAIKWWIGNAAEDGRAATVFARLKVPAQDGKWRGGVRRCPASMCAWITTYQTLVVCHTPSYATISVLCLLQ